MDETTSDHYMSGRNRPDLNQTLTDQTVGDYVRGDLSNVNQDEPSGVATIVWEM